MAEMTPERAVDNAIASTKMEGFVVTDEHRELIMKLMSGEITTDDAFEVLKKKYE